MKWNVGAKIGTGSGLALLILVIVGAVSHHSTSGLIETSDWVAHTHTVLEKLGNTIQALTDAETGQRGYVITADETYLEPYQNSIATIEQNVADIKSLTIDNQNQQRRIDLLEPYVKQRMASLKEGIDLQKTKGVEAARQWVMTGKGKKEMDDIRRLVGEMTSEERSLLRVRSAEAQASAENTKLTILLGTTAAFLFLCFASFFLTRSISKPLKEITLTAQKMAAGDLNVTVSARQRQDEVGVLAQAFSVMIQWLRGMADVAKKISDGDLRVDVKPQSDKDILGNAFAAMITNLRKITRDIAEGASVLGASAAQIVASSSQLASSSAQTASAVAETTTTVEEVRQTAQVSTQKARAVADNAQNAASISQTGKQNIEKTNEGTNRIREQMDSIAQSMMRLSEQTQAISQIITSVDDLAQQSNLLAVNASIEAAKAGEQGRGFSVVAQEVKSLAEQSKTATTQVRTILNDIQKATGAAVMATEQGTKAVEIGGTQSAQAGESILMLAGSVTEAAQAATQIAASSQQQLVGMDQVALAMESIKQASTQNVDSAKQLEGAARNIDDLGRKLRESIERFRCMETVS